MSGGCDRECRGELTHDLDAVESVRDGVLAVPVLPLLARLRICGVGVIP